MQMIDCKKVIEADRITLPTVVKKELKVAKGDYVSFSRNEHGQIVIQKVVA